MSSTDSNGNQKLDGFPLESLDAFDWNGWMTCPGIRKLHRALKFFLGPERWVFIFYSGVLLTVSCYVLVPPYIVGSIATFSSNM